MLSVALAVFNEEKVLRRCLEAVRSIADEIVIVDGGSTDSTLEIAKEFGAKIKKTSNPPMFHINKQKAVEMCKHEWILQLDADEVVSAELAKQITQVVAGKFSPDSGKKLKNFLKHQAYALKQDIQTVREQYFTQNQQVNGFFIPRLNMFLGGALRHGGVYPDGVIRLFRNGYGHFPCESVHEQIEIEGAVSWLSADLLHYGDPTFSRYLLRANRYTSLTAEKMLEDNLSVSVANLLWYTIFKPMQTFLLLGVRHKGFLDGFPGIVFALFSGLHHAIAYMKYLEMKRVKV